MMYLLALAASTVLGYLCVVRLRRTAQLSGTLVWIFAVCLGLGLSGIAVFILHLVAGWHAAWTPIAVVMAAISLMLICPSRVPIEPFHIRGGGASIILLFIIGIFMLCEANYYPLGGWDAWSCWNLKAKFIYLGRESWKDIFDPILWRSNTQYPLLLPCITVWFWDWIGQAPQWVPMLNSALFTVLSAGILLFTLKKIVTGTILLENSRKIVPVTIFQKLAGKLCLSQFFPLVLTAAVFLVPFNVTLGASQYNDVVVGMFLIAAFSCLLLDEFLLCGVFLGLLSFTKTEGMAAALILAAIIVWKMPKARRAFLVSFLAALLPTLIFQLTMAPHNEAFVNGLLSTLKPSTLERLQMVLVYPLFEIIHMKWNGIWIWLILSAAVTWRHAFTGRQGMFALFAGTYLIVLLAYYQINTFFDIRWWMDNTLSRLLYALLPAIALWVGISLNAKK